MFIIRLILKCVIKSVDLKKLCFSKCLLILGYYLMGVHYHDNIMFIIRLILKCVIKSVDLKLINNGFALIY